MFLETMKKSLLRSSTLAEIEMLATADRWRVLKAVNSFTALTGGLIRILSGKAWTKHSNASLKRRFIYPFLSLFVIMAGVYCGSKKEETIKIGTEQSKPGKVTGFQVTHGNASVNMSWNAVEGASEYKIFMDDNSKNSQELQTHIPSKSAKQNRTLMEGLGGVAMKNGTKYAFQIAASNAQGLGPLSDKLEMVPRPEHLSSLNNLSANTGDGQVTLTWNATPLATDYIVFRKLTTEGEESFRELPNQNAHLLRTSNVGMCSDAGDYRYEDTTPSNGTSYDYKVKAVMVIDLEGAATVTAADDNAVQRMIIPQMLTTSQVIVCHKIDNSLPSGGQVTLTIGPPQSTPMGVTITGYKIEVLDIAEAPINENGMPIILYETGSGMVTYSVSQLQPHGEARKYKVTAQSGSRVDIMGSSNTHLVGSITPAPPVAMDLAIFSITEAKIVLRWSYEGTATHYTLTRSIDGAAATDIFTSKAVGTFDTLPLMSVTPTKYTYTDAHAFGRGVGVTYTLTPVILGNNAFADQTGDSLGISGTTPAEITEIADSIIESALQVHELGGATLAEPLVYAKPIVGSGTSIRTAGGANVGGDEARDLMGPHYPFGMSLLTPANAKKNKNQWGADPRGFGFRSQRMDQVYAFAMTAMPGPGCDTYYDFPIMVHEGQHKSTSLYSTDTSNSWKDSVNDIGPLYIKGASATGTQNSRTGNYRHGDTASFSDANALVAEPGYLKITFQNAMIFEGTTGVRVGIAKFTLPSTFAHATLFLANTNINKRHNFGFLRERPGATNTVEGKIRAFGFCGDTRNTYEIYMVAEYNLSPITNGTTIRQFGKMNSSGQPVQYTGGSFQTTDKQYAAEFDVSINKVLTIKYGLSFVSTDNALANLKAEINNDFDFEALKTSTQTAWKSILNGVRVADKNLSTKTKELEMFYSSMYHVASTPMIFNDANGDYIGFNNSIYKTENLGYRRRNHYHNFSGWDTYRSQSQMVALLSPTAAADQAESLINNSRQSNCDQDKIVDGTGTSAPNSGCGGSLTRWGVANDDSGTMAGEPGAIILANSLVYGASEINLHRGYEAMLRGNEYKPSDNKYWDSRGASFKATPEYSDDSASRQEHRRANALEHASAYFAKAVYAKMLSKFKTDASYAAKYKITTAQRTALSAATIYDAEATGIFAESQLKFECSHVPGGSRWTALTSGSAGSARWTRKDCHAGSKSNAAAVKRDHTDWREGNGYQHLWMYPSNVAGTTNSIKTAWFGSSTMAQVNAALNIHLRQLNQGTSGNGLFFGNEPGHFTPFVFNFLHKDGATNEALYAPGTAKVVRRIQFQMYDNTPHESFPGNDDLGAMSAWWAWSAIGLYPAIPGFGMYTLTAAPLFNKIIIRKRNGNSNEAAVIVISSNTDARVATGVNTPNSVLHKALAGYITGLTLNGVAHNKTYIMFRELYANDAAGVVTHNLAGGKTLKVTRLNFTTSLNESDAKIDFEPSPSFPTLASVEAKLQ